MSRSATRRTSMDATPISADLLHVAKATARTAVQGAGEVGGELSNLVGRTARGTWSAAVAIADDLVTVSRRAASGMGQGIRELRDEFARLPTAIRPVSHRKPSRRATRSRRARRPTPATS